MKVAWEVIQQLVDKGLSGREIAEQVGLNKQSLYKRLVRNGVRLKTNEVVLDEKEVVAKYESGMTMSEIAKEHSCSTKPVFAIVKKSGVSRKPGNCARIHHTFFEKINSEEKAYWLGVLFADGSVGSGVQKTISFTVAADDVEWVERFKKAIGSDVKITFRKNKWKGAAEFVVTSEKMWIDLNKLGVIPRKSLVCKLPVIEPSLMKHMVRGLIDGDGSIAKAQRQISLVTGSEKVKEQFGEYVNSLGLEYKVAKGTCWKIMVNAENAVVLGDELYGGATVMLRRKFVQYKSKLKGEGVELREGCKEIGLDVARVFVQKYHYLSSIKPSKTFGWYVGDVLCGVAAVSSCSSPSVAKTVFGQEYASKVRELHRFCLSDIVVKNTASQFLAIVLKKYGVLNPNVWAVVSFADPAQNHEGIIYKAVSAVELKTEQKDQLVVILPNNTVVTGRQDDMIARVESAGFELSQCSLRKSAGKKKFVMFVGTKDVRRKSRELLSCSKC